MLRRSIIASTRVFQLSAVQTRTFAEDRHLHKGGSDPARTSTEGTKRPASGESLSSSEMKSQRQGDKHTSESTKLDKNVGEKKFESDTLNEDSPQQRAAKDTLKK